MPATVSAIALCQLYKFTNLVWEQLVSLVSRSNTYVKRYGYLILISIPGYSGYLSQDKHLVVKKGASGFDLRKTS